MIPIGAETPQAVRGMLPWLALGHGIFNALVMLCFCCQGWLGHVIRRSRLAGGPAPLPMVRRHRRFGPWLVVLGWAGFLAGLIIVLIDEGRVAEHPLHFSLGLVIVLTQAGAFAASRKIRGRGPEGRGLHRLLGILILCLYPVQVFVGLGILL
jgi:peptidoglycan/LPS O-acetylase OafA/YrhL